MGVYRNFPYSNFHEMNMDEIIKIIKNMLEEWATYHAEWDHWMDEMEDDCSNYQDVMNEAWQNMQDFINNYFDNLDVQEEINNKIVSMIQTGEFGLLVNEYIPPAVNAWLNLNITQPTGVVIDTSLSVAGACADAKATGDAINDLKGYIGISDVTFTKVTGKYISYNGNEYTSAPFNRSVPIAVNKGEIINFIAAGYNTEVAMIAISNSDATSFTPKVNSIDSTVRLYTYTVEDDGYIVVSYDKSETHELVIKSAEISNEALNNRLNALNENYIKGIIEDSDLSIIVNDSSLAIGQAGKYVNKNSGVSNTASFSISVPITLEKGQYLIFNARGYLNEVAVLAKVNLDSTYTALIKSVDNDEHTFKYLATENVTVVVSSNNNVSVRYSVFSSRIDKQDMRIKELENDWFAFAKMGIIGDSLASGASNYGGGASDRKLYSWGKYIEREHGVDVSLFSFGGATTRTWLTSNYGYTALQSADVLDLYVIGLGVNDAYELGSEYLGTIAEVHVGDESLNADTYYGNYSKIIAAIKAKSPRAKIICLTNPKATTELELSYNHAVSDIVALYTNTYLIDLIDDSFYTSAEFNATWNSAHSTAIGYKLIAKNLYNHISELVRNNVSEFLDIQWIIENHA